MSARQRGPPVRPSSVHAPDTRSPANLLVANASTIKRHASEIGDVYNAPVVALEKITHAHNELVEAMNIADQLKTEGIASARENIQKLVQLADELQERAESLSEQREAPSLEA